MNQASDSLAPSTTSKTTDSQNQTPSDNHNLQPHGLVPIGEQGQSDIGGAGASDAYESDHEAFHEATGLNNLPAPGRANIEAQNAETQAQRAEGISRGKIVSYQDSSGQTITGGQYTNREGTFFKTAGGDTYKVEHDGNSFSLESTQPGGQTIQASRVNRLNDSFSANPTADGTPTGGSELPPAKPGATGTPAGGAELPAPNVAPKDNPTAPVPKDNPTAPVPKDSPTVPAAQQPPAPMDAGTFYSSYKAATTPQEQQQLANYVHSLPQQEQGQFIRQVAHVAQETDGSNARGVLSSLRESVRSTANANNDGSDAGHPPAKPNPNPNSNPVNQGTPTGGDAGPANPPNPPGKTPVGDVTTGNTQSPPGQPPGGEAPAGGSFPHNDNHTPPPGKQPPVADSTVPGPVPPGPRNLLTPTGGSDAGTPPPGKAVVPTGTPTGGEALPVVPNRHQLPQAGNEVVPPVNPKLAPGLPVPESTVPGTPPGGGFRDRPGGGEQGSWRHNDNANANVNPNQNGTPLGGSMGRGPQSGDVPPAGVAPHSTQQAQIAAQLSARGELPGGQPGQIPQPGQAPFQGREAFSHGDAHQQPLSPAQQQAMLQGRLEQAASAQTADRVHPVPPANLEGRAAAAPPLDANVAAQAQLVAKSIVPGLDLNSAQNRQFLMDALKQINQANVGPFDPRGPIVKDVLHGFDPEKVNSLQAFLIKGADGKGLVQVNDAAVHKMSAIMTVIAQASPERVAGSAATDLGARPRSAAEQLLDTLRRPELQAAIPGQGNPFAIQNLQNALLELNKQRVQDGQALTLTNLISRGIQQPLKPGEREGAGEQKGATESGAMENYAATLIARLTPAQQQLIQNLAGQQMRIEPARQDAAAMAAQRPAQLEPAKVEAKPDGKQEVHLEVKAEIKHDVKFESKPELKPETRKPEDTKLDAAKVDRGRIDAIVRDTKIDARSETKSDTGKAEADEALAEARAHGMGLHGAKDKEELEEELKLKRKHEEEERRHDQEEKARQEAAMMALMLAQKGKEAKEKEKKESAKNQDQNTENDSRRRRYVVRENDTLESIATAQLRNVKLAPLIYEINKNVISARVVDGQKRVDLKPKLVIWLPSPADIRAFGKSTGGLAQAGSAPATDTAQMTAEEELTKRFGDWDGSAQSPGKAMSDEEREKADRRRANVESLLGQIGAAAGDQAPAHVVRLGDTLKSVAMKHPLLQDVMLWKLLAETNGLPTDVDGKGVPVAKLSRGMRLTIPSQEAIGSYRAAHNMKAPQPNLKPCPNCSHTALQASSICTHCGHVFERPVRRSGQNQLQRTAVDESSIDVGSSVARQDAEILKVGDEVKARPRVDYPEGVEPRIEQFDELTRLVRFETLLEDPAEVWQIEVLREGFWEPAICYEILAASSLRNEFSPDGIKQNVKLELQAKAVAELANNDLRSNWKNYRDRYIAQSMTMV